MNELGNFNVKIKIDTWYDIPTEDIVVCSVYEDIFNFCLSGTIEFRERSGWLEKTEGYNGIFPLAISWKEGDNQVIQKEFNVYRTKPHAAINQLDSTKAVKWTFLESLHEMLHYVRINSCPWGEKVKGSDIVKDIYTKVMGGNMEDFVQFEETNETFDYFNMGYKTSAEAIRYIQRRCTSVKDPKTPGFLFFTNSKGLNFTTLPLLLFNKKREENNKIVWNGQDDNINRVLGWYYIPPSMDKAKNIGGANIYNISFDSREVVENKVTFADMFDNQLGNIIGNYGDSAIYPDISNPSSPSLVFSETDPNKSINIWKTLFLYDYTTSLTSYLKIRGDSTRYAGMIIDVEWPSSVSSNTLDPMLSGEWLVKTVAHHFCPNNSLRYNQILVCVKPAFGKLEGKNYPFKGGIKTNSQKTTVATTV